MSKAKTIKLENGEYRANQHLTGVVEDINKGGFCINMGNVCSHKISDKTYKTAVSAGFYRDLKKTEKDENSDRPLNRKKCTVNNPDKFLREADDHITIYAVHPEDQSKVYKLKEVNYTTNGFKWTKRKMWHRIHPKSLSGKNMEKVGYGDAIETKTKRRIYQQKKSQDKKRKKKLSAKKSDKKKTDEKRELVNIKRKKQKDEVEQQFRNPQIETFQDTTFEKIEKFQALIQQAKNLFDEGIYDEKNYKNAVQKYNSKMSLLF